MLDVVPVKVVTVETVLVEDPEMLAEKEKVRHFWPAGDKILDALLMTED
jgi:hypothetical protein